MKKSEANVTSSLPSREGLRVSLLPSFYLAPISYYAQLLRCESVVIDRDEIYRKQTLRNRCYIASPNGPLALTIPVVKFVPYHTPMRDIRISDHGNWRHLHWNALQSSYGRTPFFEFYADDFAPFYEKKWEFLFDYNQALQTMVSELMGVETCSSSLRRSALAMLSPNEVTERTRLLSSPSASFTLHPSSFTLPPYYQLFSDRQGFMPDLSIVDLLFNLGPESILYLTKLRLPDNPESPEYPVNPEDTENTQK